MMIAKFLVPLALCGIAAPAASAVMVIGSTSARLCFEAAVTHAAPVQTNIGHCDAALRDNLNGYDEVATFVNRGILRMRKGAIEEAISDFDAAIARNPNQPEAYLNKGMAALRLPDAPVRAVPLFDAALAKDTQRPALAYYGRAVAHEMGGRIKAAYRDYKQASLIEPKWQDPRVELSRFSVRRR